MHARLAALGFLRIVAFITEPKVIDRILEHLRRTRPTHGQRAPPRRWKSAATPASLSGPTSCQQDVPRLTGTAGHVHFGAAYFEGRKASSYSDETNEAAVRRLLRLRSSEYEILGRGVVAAPNFRGESGRVLDPVESVQLLRSAASDPLAVRSLRLALTDQLGTAGLHRRSDREVFDDFARLLANGRVALRSLALPAAPATRPKPEPEPEPEAEPRKAARPFAPKQTVALTWIEIVLVDEEDNPVAGEKCKLTASNGALVGNYKTDSRGKVRVDDIEPGTYSVCFTELDQDA